MVNANIQIDHDGWNIKKSNVIQLCSLIYSDRQHTRWVLMLSSYLKLFNIMSHLHMEVILSFFFPDSM